MCLELNDNISMLANSLFTNLVWRVSMLFSELASCHFLISIGNYDITPRVLKLP